MSKIGKKPIIIPEGSSVLVEDGSFVFKGKNGEMSVKILPFIKYNIEGNNVVFSIDNESKQATANWGTMRSLANNAIIGVNEGFTKVLEIEGVGFKVAMDGNNLNLSLGFSHPVKFIAPEGIKLTVEKNVIKVSGIDKTLVGQTAAKIRELKKPEPYKGKGIRYQGEVIRRKEGKKAAGATK